MRRAALALITGVMLFTLTACSSAGEAGLDELRERFEVSGGVTVTADVTSTTEGRYEEYTLECSTVEGALSVKVIAPEEIAGVTARFDTDSAELDYDGLVLSFTEPGEVTPITSLPTLLQALENAYLALSWTEGDNTFFSLQATDSLTVTVELDGNGTPVWAEFIVDGEAVSQCEITQFSIN